MRWGAGHFNYRDIWGGGSLPGHSQEGKSHDEQVLLGRAWVSTRALGTVATGASRGQGPDPALALGSLTRAAHLLPWRPGRALTFQGTRQEQVPCVLALADKLALRVVARWPRVATPSGVSLRKCSKLQMCKSTLAVSLGSDNYFEKPSALGVFTIFGPCPRCNLKTH